MKKKNLALIAVAAITATTLVGCNNDAKPTETTGTPAQTTTIDQDAEDREIVAAAKDGLSVQSTATADFTLTVAAAGGASIAWTSNNAAITINGATAKVTRPGFGSEAAVVTLTATIVSGNISDTKTFEVTIAALTDESETVTELKAKAKDTEVYARGIVTGFLYASSETDGEYKKGFYLTDGTDTIYVFDSAAAADLEDNQEVYFAATVDEYSGAKQLKSVSELAVLADDATPDFGYATVLKDDKELKAAIDLGANAVGKTYEFLAQVYCNSYGSYSLEPIDYDNYKASWGVYFSGSSSPSLEYYGAELKGKDVARVIFYVDSTNSSNKGRGIVLDVKPLTEEDKKASVGLVLGNAVKLDGLYSAETTTIALPTTLEGYEDFEITWELATGSTGAEITEDAETHAKSLVITAGTDVCQFTLVGKTSYETTEVVYTAAADLTAWAENTEYYTRSGEEGAYVYTLVDQATVTAPVEGTTYYTAAENTVTKNVEVTDKASSVLLDSLTFQDITEGIAGKNKDDIVYLSGVITSIVKNNSGKVTNVYVNDGTTEFQLYNGLVETSVIAADDLVVGKYISFLGTYSPYNGVPETNGTANVIKMEDATETQKVNVTGTEFAFDDLYNNVTDQTLATKGTVFENVAVSWTVKTGTTATITDGKLNVTRGAADEEVTLTATITLGAVTKDFDYTFTVYSADKLRSVAAYTGSTTTNMTGGNDAATVGLSATVFSFIGDKQNNSNYPGLNKDGQIRLYKNTGIKLSLIDNTAYAIDKVVINFGGTVGKAKINGGASQTLTKNSALEVDMTGLTEFTIYQDNSNNTQIFILSIEIYYHAVTE